MRDRIKRKYRKYGILAVLWAAVRRVLRFVFCVKPITRTYRKIKIKFIRLYLWKRYDYVIEKYKNYVPPARTSNYLLDDVGVVWSMWWQGEENVPETVKLCLASIRKHCNSHKFIIITKDNYQEYLDLPEHIISKVNAGYISLTHLSDIIRVNLLATYGGLWIDSTLFVANDLSDEIFETEYYTIKYIQAKWNIAVPKCSWTGFFFASRDRNSLFPSFMSEMFSEYWKTHKTLIDYFLIDHCISIAFNTFQEFHEAWSKIPYNNPEWFCLPFGEGEEWNAEMYSDLISSTTVFKTTYKAQYDKKTIDGKQTFYGHLLAEYGITE